MRRLAIFLFLAAFASVFQNAATPLAGAATVHVTDEAGRIHLSNGKVEMEIEKETAQLRSLRFEGRELLGPGKGYVQIAGDNSSSVR